MNTKNQRFSACWVVLECRKEEWCCRGGSNSGPLPYQGSALPLSYGSNWRWAMAAREARIHARPTPVAQGGFRRRGDAAECGHCDDGGRCAGGRAGAGRRRGGEDARVAHIEEIGRAHV